MMEKYGTYRLFVNKETGEEKQIQITDEEELTKIANDSEWEEEKEDEE